MTATEQHITGNSELFAGLLNEAGLDFMSAALLLSEPTQRVRLWFTGTETPPATAIWTLCKFLKTQNDMADQIYQKWEKSGRPERMKHPVSICDKSAQKLGWPSRDAQVVAVTKAQVKLAPVLIDIVPAASKTTKPVNSENVEA